MDMDLAKFFGAMDAGQVAALLDYVLPKNASNKEMVNVVLTNNNPEIDVRESNPAQCVSDAK